MYYYFCGKGTLILENYHKIIRLIPMEWHCLVGLSDFPTSIFIKITLLNG